MRWVSDDGVVAYDQTFTCGCGTTWAPDAAWPLRAQPGDLPIDVPLFCPKCLKYAATFNPRIVPLPTGLRRLFRAIAQLWRVLVCRMRGHRSVKRQERSKQLPPWLECTRCKKLQALP